MSAKLLALEDLSHLLAGKGPTTMSAQNEMSSRQLTGMEWKYSDAHTDRHRLSYLVLLPLRVTAIFYTPCNAAGSSGNQAS
jgi:hypothetical protein